MSKPKRCSFCGHSQTDWQVEVLISARPETHAHICDKCVDTCLLTLKHHKIDRELRQLKAEQRQKEKEKADV